MKLSITCICFLFPKKLQHTMCCIVSYCIAELVCVLLLVKLMHAKLHLCISSMATSFSRLDGPASSECRSSKMPHIPDACTANVSKAKVGVA